MIFIYYILFILQVVFQAKWEAELLTPGPSNHVFQLLQLSMILSVVVLSGLKKQNRFQMLMVIIGYICIRFSMFDYLLNHFRGLSIDYIGETEKMKAWLGVNIMSILRTVAIISAIIGAVFYMQEEKYKKFMS